MARYLVLVLALSAVSFAGDHRPTSCGPIDQEWSIKPTDRGVPIPPAPSDKAVIVFLNRTRISSDRGFKIGADGRWFADTRTKTYAYFILEPGEHHLCGETGKKFRAVMPLRVEAGKVYFVGNSVTSDFFGEPTLEAVNDDQAQVYMQRFKLAISEPKN